MLQLLKHNIGTRRLTHFVARRDYVKSLLWLVGLTAFAVFVTYALNDVYGSPESLVAMVETLKNPAMIALVGPVYGASHYTLGAMTAGEMLLMTATLVAVVNIFFVVRYTRADEEQERMEVIRSLPVGRLAPLNAALIGAAVFNALLTAGIGLGFMALNFDPVTTGIDLQGGLLFGGMCGAIGLVFAGVAAVFAQLASTSRGAIAYSSVFLGALYLLRAVGDVRGAAGETLARVSPLGLGLRVEAFSGNHFWPLPWLALEALAFIAVAYVLNTRRDLGAGFIAARAGRSHAAAGLGTAPGLAWRLLRTTMIGWAVTMLVLGATYGSIMGDVETFINSNDFFKAALAAPQGYTLAESFAALIMVVMSGMATAPLLQVALKARQEESAGRAEHVLACGVSRPGFFASYAALAALASVVMPLCAALGVWTAAAAVMDEPFKLSFILKAQLVYVPALWLFLAIALLAMALVPRAASALSWGYFIVSFLLSYFGRLFTGLPEWLPKLVPFGYVPRLPMEDINWTTMSLMSALALALAAVAFVLYRRRDLQTS